MRGVGDNGASRSPDHAAGNRCTGGSAGETSDQGTAARSDQRTAQHAILPSPRSEQAAFSSLNPPC